MFVRSFGRTPSARRGSIIQVRNLCADLRVIHIIHERRARRWLWTTMETLAANALMFAILFGGWEVVLILAVLLILFGAKKLPEIVRGLGEGVSEFRKSSGQVINELDQNAHDAGKGLGGIYGKPAAQALTPDNQTAELYDPGVFHKQGEIHLNRNLGRFRAWSRLWRSIRRLLKILAG